MHYALPPVCAHTLYQTTPPAWGSRLQRLLRALKENISPPSPGVCCQQHMLQDHPCTGAPTTQQKPNKKHPTSKPRQGCNMCSTPGTAWSRTMEAAWYWSPSIPGLHSLHSTPRHPPCVHRLSGSSVCSGGCSSPTLPRFPLSHTPNAAWGPPVSAAGACLLTQYQQLLQWYQAPRLR